MHRGSSKGAREARAPETLPLSAPPALVLLQFEVARGGSIDRQRLEVPRGTLLRVALRRIGQAPEGCAVLRDGRPVPLDIPLERSETLTVVPTFSGG